MFSISTVECLWRKQRESPGLQSSDPWLAERTNGPRTHQLQNILHRRRAMSIVCVSATRNSAKRVTSLLGHSAAPLSTSAAIRAPASGTDDSIMFRAPQLADAKTMVSVLNPSSDDNSSPIVQQQHVIVPFAPRVHDCSTILFHLEHSTTTQHTPTWCTARILLTAAWVRPRTRLAAISTVHAKLQSSKLPVSTSAVVS